jgi:hypothetical protein
MYMILYVHIITPALLDFAEHEEAGKCHVVSFLAMPS